MKHIILTIVLLKMTMLFATDRTMLWPSIEQMPYYQSHQVAAMMHEVSKKGFDQKAHRMPYLEWHEPKKDVPKSDACMIFIPGGGYAQCSESVKKKCLDKFQALGITCVSLVYRTPRAKKLPFYATAWADGQRAVRLVRSEAERRGFNPEKIGVVGMSAGSHLSLLLAASSQTNAYAATDKIDETPCHVNWACLFALAYAKTDGLGIPNTREGDAADSKLDSIFKFDNKTCPIWMSHGSLDQYSPFASTAAYRKLRKMKIPSEVHIYADQKHRILGVDRAVEFMWQMGFLGKLPPAEKLMDRYSGDDARKSYSKENVWPKGKVPSYQEHQCEAYLEWHHPKVLKTKAVQIIYSGGSYQGNDPDGFEVAPARRYLNERGMTVVTMRYRTPRPEGLSKHTSAWQDLQRAVRIVRKEAPSYGLDPERIGIMGSSAGGHLTLMGATSSRRKAYAPIDEIDKISCNVQWAIAIYPAYLLTDGEDKYNEFGGNDDSSRLAREFSFDLSTCPVLFIHGDSDPWAAMNSVKCWEQLSRMGIQSELHTLALRSHCFQKPLHPIREVTHGLSA
jgi:acetyl esterase/lipase